MTHKDKIINAIMRLDYKALDNLIDEETNCLEVSKSIFLEEFKRDIQYGYGDITHFKTVIKGECKSNWDCCEGQNPYRFITNNNYALDLSFHYRNNKLQAIVQCDECEVNVKKFKDLLAIWFHFYTEDEISFRPHFSYLIDVQKADKATEEFYKMTKDKFVAIEDLAYWRDKHKYIALEDGLNDFYGPKGYKAFVEIDQISVKVWILLKFYDKKSYAINAMYEYNQLDQNKERDIVKWLLKHGQIQFDNYYKKHHSWKKTSLLILETDPEVVVDCSYCKISLQYNLLYEQIEDKIKEKYKPTMAHFEKSDGCYNGNLQNLLRLHNAYLDLLEYYILSS